MNTKNTNCILKTILSVCLALILEFVVLTNISMPLCAFAETDNIYAEANEAQRLVEQSAQEYNESCVRLEELEQSIQVNQNKLDELEEQLPEKEVAYNNALVSLYVNGPGEIGLLDLFFASNTLSDLIKTYDYFCIWQAQLQSDLNALIDTKQELEAVGAELNTQKLEAQKEQERAAIALEEAKAQREEAQRRAQEAAQREAEEREAAERAKAESEKQASQNTESNEKAEDASQTIESPKADGADWSADKAVFVQTWSGRLDSYLSGSPLAGCGSIFAAAAWDYGIDPRFSAAISTVESSKGAYCFKPYNAWGWGSVSWSSWEEAINAHTAGLARGYGYTVSVEGAKKYCPPNWEHWYNRVSQEMNKI